MSKLIRLIALGLVFFTWTAGDALALGAFITEGGTTVGASRSIIVRHGDAVQLITQVRYEGSPSPMVWLVAVPNVNNPIDNGVRVTAYGQDPLDLLDDLTRPNLRGVCDGEPSGDAEEARMFPFGPANPENLPSRIFSAPDIDAGELDAYITDLGLTIDEATRTTINEAYNQNYMFVAARIDAAELGVARVDPIVSIQYPVTAGDDIKLAIRPLETVVGDGPADVVLWVLGNGRANSNIRTGTVDHADVSFAPNGTTNYIEAFDAQVGVRQTLMFMAEYAGDYDDWGTQAGNVDGSAELEALVTESGARFLTRLRARFSPAAIRTSAAFLTLSTGGAEPYARLHDVQGAACGAPEPDMGGSVPADDMGPPQSDAGPDAGATDASMEPAPSGGGDDGGCRVSLGGNDVPAALFLLMFLIFPFVRRRLTL